MHVASAHLPPSIRSEIFCGACGIAAHQVDSVDPFVICLTCPSQHKFLVYPDGPLAIDTARATTHDCPNFEDDPTASARYWLTDSTARSVLNSQLAMLFRAFLEGHGPSPELEFSFCPQCAAPLYDFEQDDIWVVGRACSRGHKWAHRGGHLRCVIEGKQFGLTREYSLANTQATAAWWLKPDRYSRLNLHVSMYRVLEAIA